MVNNRLSLLSMVIFYRYLVTTSILFKTILSYILNMIDRHYYGNEWSDKALFDSIVQVFTGGFVTVSNIFLLLFLRIHQVRPINLFRYLIRNIVRFCSSVTNLINAYLSTQRIFQFPVPTNEELARVDVCPICLSSFNEDFDGGISSEPRIIPACKHVFHFVCLKRWVRTQQACPTCRQPI